MLKHVLAIFILALLAAMPQGAFARDIEAVEMEQLVQEIKIKVEGRKVFVEGAEGKSLLVYDVAGNVVMQVEIDSDSKQVTVNAPRGLYIIRVGSVTRKIQIS